MVGGIAGYAPKGTIVECGNNAEVSASRGYAGGIAGGGSSKNGSVKITYCYNAGNISGYGDDGTGYTSVGGIVGVRPNVTYCYNTGNVYGAKGQAAGICGNMYNNTNVIEYCYNTGVISGGGRAIGSIIGEGYNAKASYCYWTSSQGCIGYRGRSSNCRKMTEEELKAYTNDKFVTDTNNPQINSGFPILYWQNKN